MAFSVKPLDQSEYVMKIVQDLGMLPNQSNTRKIHFALFECTKCNQPFKARANSSASKKQTTCEACANLSHNLSKHPLYSIWNGIKQRCYSSARKDYKKYGQKGVTMCEEWRDSPEAFIAWCTQNGWEPGLCVDKDIKCRELGITPAIYSSSTVSFITAQENAEEAVAKEVHQYDSNNNYLATFPSTAKAALSLGKPYTARSSIANCARGLTKTAFGFIWKYNSPTT